MTAVFAVRMLSPAARHAEFIPLEMAAVEGAQDRLHLAAEMRFDPHAAPFQSPQQLFGQCGAEQHIHAQFRYAPRQSFRRKRTKNKFAPRHFLPAPVGNQKQPRRSVEHRRNAFLQNGNGNQHTYRSAGFMPAPNWLADKSKFPLKSGGTVIIDPSRESVLSPKISLKEVATVISAQCLLG